MPSALWQVGNALLTLDSRAGLLWQIRMLLLHPVIGTLSAMEACGVCQLPPRLVICLASFCALSCIVRTHKSNDRQS